jgi:hypothetical protein
MRNVTRYLPLFLLAACQQKPTENITLSQPTNTSKPVAAAEAGLTVAQRLSPIISGHWVSADYLQVVARTHSPAAAFENTPPSPTSLEIRNFATQKDSVEIGASYGLHEGGNLMLLLQPGSQTGSLRIRELYGTEASATNELAYQITPTDTTLFYITRKSNTQQPISKIAYRRTGTPGKNSDLEAGVELGVNKLLLSGSYLGTDSIGHQVAAQFHTDGRLTGLPFKKYTIQTDFSGPNPGDEVIFDVYTKQQREFAAVYGHDTVRLYSILSSTGASGGEVDPTNVFTRGRLRYQLIRIKRP